MATKTEVTEKAAEKKNVITLRGAIFIGIGAMVGAGIFALFGQAGTMAGAAVWVSFFVGGVIALLQGYSFSKLGARFPSRGGMIDWIVRGFGGGLFTGGLVMLGYFSILIVCSMVAVTFGSYASSLFLGEGAPLIWNKFFAVLILCLLTYVNSVGSDLVTRAQTVIVGIVLTILTLFAVAMLLNMDTTLLAPANYPPMSGILASVALTFFAYLGFGVIAFTGGEMENPAKNMPRAMFISLGLVMLLYVALAVGVFGTLSVDEVIANADTALAVAAMPIFGQAGFAMISIAALFATTGAINSNLFASMGVTFAMAKDGHLPAVFGEKRKFRAGGTKGLVISALIMIVLAVLFDVSAIASIGSAVFLSIYVMITIAHLRLAGETKASKFMLYLALALTILALLLFGAYTLQTAPQTFVFLTVTIILAWVVEAIWRRISNREVSVVEAK